MQAKEEKMKRFVSVFHSPYTAWLILFIGLALTFTAWRISSGIVEKSGAERFSVRVKEIRNAIHFRMIEYEHALWGCVGLFNTQPQLSRKQFKTYVDTLKISENWPGIQGIGYSVPVTQEEKESHIQRIRRDGFPSYSIKPEGPRDEYSAIVFLEPFDWRNQRAFGFDMWSNETRRSAMTRARDSGQASTSGIITLVQETDKDVQNGFLTYLPHYKEGAPLTTAEERSEALLGWVYSPFRMQDLMKGILGSDSSAIHYQIYDGAELSKGNLLFDSDNEYFEYQEQDSPWVITESIELQGRTWTLVFTTSNDHLYGSEKKQPLAVATAGLIVDLLLFYVITSLAYLQRRAESIANEMTAEIREAKERLELEVDQSERLVLALKQSNAELTQFAFIASHDLREPLRKIKTFGNMLRDEVQNGLSERGESFLQIIERGAGRMDKLLDSLLAYSRVSTKERTVQAVDLNVVLKDVISDLSIVIADAQGKIQVSPLPTVAGDPSQLRQLFQNLISNSLKYQAKDITPLVQVSCRQENGKQLIEVQDNGIGFENEYAQKIFDVFQRLHGRNEYPGTGMGLSICRRIAERHSGSISAIGDPGRGATFTVSLPDYKEERP